MSRPVLASQGEAKNVPPAVNSTSSDVRFDESATCERCGRFGAYAFDGQAFCTDCYATRCSCCPEFGVDDLWTRDAAGNQIPKADTDLRCQAKK